ncbi:MAG: peptidoglycan-associated lipoprotein [Rhodospirillum sp.]|jgi:peptidoglycan-associated lipoprotein|nr:peptidoglycan-associated lipoprotein [Rhodospirillum sp.]
MSKIQFVSSRAALASAALLSLALLSACQSKDGPVSGGEVASTDTQPPISDPAPEQLPPFNGELVRVGDRVQFELDRYDLSPEAEATLQKQAALLQLYPEIVITIEGHADERGTREYNLALGERRADAVRNYLAALGVSTGRVSVISYGKERPACPEASEGCWSQNRRGVTVASQ